MPMGIDVGARSDTLATAERKRGRVGPPPEEGRMEIHLGRLEDRDVVAKAGAGDLSDRLRREAEVLRRIDSPPLVELAELVEGADHTELVTFRFGSLTLAESGLLDPWECGRALVEFCDAVEQMHSSGWAHGSLEMSHVVVDPGEGVRLCSLAGACETDSTEGRTALATDRDALAGIVAEVLQRPPGFDSSSARRKWRRAARRALPRLVSARGLRTPEQVRDILSEVRLPGADGAPRSVDADGTTSGSSAAGSRAGILVLAGVLALVSAAVAWFIGVGSDDVEVEPLCADVDGDGRCDDVDITGQVVEVNGAVFTVGEKGDVVRLGDWNCDGRATGALLRPESGALFAFDGWSPAEGATIEGEYVGRYGGAVSIVEQTECGPIFVEHPDGTQVDTSAAATEAE